MNVKRQSSKFNSISNYKYFEIWYLSFIWHLPACR
jgi:hypothetical protein